MMHPRITAALRLRAMPDRHLCALLLRRHRALRRNHQKPHRRRQPRGLCLAVASGGGEGEQPEEEAERDPDLGTARVACEDDTGGS